MASKTVSSNIEPLNSLLKSRWSPRAFDPKRQVEPGKLWSCLEAARWAPSSFNEQPWHFVVAIRDEDPQFYKSLSAALVPFNQSWTVLAPVLILIAARKTYAKTGQENIHGRYDSGQAMSNLSLQATHLGLYVHQMSGFDPKVAHAAAQLPEGYEAVTMAVLGYKADNTSVLPDKQLQERETAERVRVPLESIVSIGRFAKVQ